jgi:uncharacterized protein YcbK (DUF882 family)
MTWTRRRVLQAGATLAGASVAGLLASTARSQDAAGSQSERRAIAPRRIGLLNLHTGERLETDYFRDGAYLPDSIAAINVLLRDFRTGDQHAIDPGLMDYLVQVARATGKDPVFSVISGYRSPLTNARLHELSSGVAAHSLHMEGRAIDVRMTGIDCADLAAQALGLQCGGVGYYRASDFVHLDTGRFRTWKG